MGPITTWESKSYSVMIYDKFNNIFVLIMCTTRVFHARKLKAGKLFFFLKKKILLVREIRFFGVEKKNTAKYPGACIINPGKIKPFIIINYFSFWSSVFTDKRMENGFHSRYIEPKPIKFQSLLCYRASLSLFAAILGKPYCFTSYPVSLLTIRRMTLIEFGNDPSFVSLNRMMLSWSVLRL